MGTSIQNNIIFIIVLFYFWLAVKHFFTSQKVLPPNKVASFRRRPTLQKSLERNKGDKIAYYTGGRIIVRVMYLRGNSGIPLYFSHWIIRGYLLTEKFEGRNPLAQSHLHSPEPFIVFNSRAGLSVAPVAGAKPSRN